MTSPDKTKSNGKTLPLLVVFLASFLASGRARMSLFREPQQRSVYCDIYEYCAQKTAAEIAAKLAPVELSTDASADASLTAAWRKMGWNR